MRLEHVIQAYLGEPLVFSDDRMRQMSTQTKERRVDGLDATTFSRVSAGNQMRRFVTVGHVLVGSARLGRSATGRVTGGGQRRRAGPAVLRRSRRRNTDCRPRRRRRRSDHQRRRPADSVAAIQSHIAQGGPKTRKLLANNQ